MAASGAIGCCCDTASGGNCCCCGWPSAAAAALGHCWLPLWQAPADALGVPASVHLRFFFATSETLSGNVSDCNSSPGLAGCCCVVVGPTALSIPGPFCRFFRLLSATSDTPSESHFFLFFLFLFFGMLSSHWLIHDSLNSVCFPMGESSWNSRLARVVSRARRLRAVCEIDSASCLMLTFFFFKSDFHKSTWCSCTDCCNSITERSKS